MSQEQNIKAYICSDLAPDIDPESLPADVDLLTSGVVDSLSLVRLIVWISEEYNLPMNDLEIAPEDFSSVEKIDGFIALHTISDIA